MRISYCSSDLCSSYLLHTRSVELAIKDKVRVQVLSSFEDASGGSLPGTLVVGDDEIGDEMERQLITGVAYSRNEAKITLIDVPDRPGAVATIFSPLAKANINEIGRAHV